MSTLSSVVAACCVPRCRMSISVFESASPTACLNHAEIEDHNPANALFVIAINEIHYVWVQYIFVSFLCFFRASCWPASRYRSLPSTAQLYSAFARSPTSLHVRGHRALFARAPTSPQQTWSPTRAECTTETNIEATKRTTHTRRNVFRDRIVIGRVRFGRLGWVGLSRCSIYNRLCKK